MGRESRRKAAIPKPTGRTVVRTPTALPPDQNSEKEQAKSMVHELWKVTFQANMPGQTHAACQQARDFLLQYIESTQPAKKA